MADWEEIRRLAADFQRTQTIDILQKISERNCIDILKKLSDLNLLELIYTCDGKEFVTPDHLRKEVEDEIYYNGGRMHLHDLASNLNVDYQHIENASRDLANLYPDHYQIVLGQIIHSTYKKTIEKQIINTMLVSGELDIAEFAKSLDMPSQFLTTLVKEILPNVCSEYVISPDERTYYTSDRIERFNSIIAGHLSAIRKPTTITSIMKRIDIPDKMFNTIMDNLLKEGRLDATIENRVYVPSVYTRDQYEFIDQFYKTNSYISYDLLSRKGIKQPKSFLTKRFPDGLSLDSIFISEDLTSQVEMMVEDCINSNSLIDISTILPASIQPEDIEQLLEITLKRNKHIASNCFVYDRTNVCSLGFISSCKDTFRKDMDVKAKLDLKSGKLMKHFMRAVKQDVSAKDSSASKDVQITKIEQESEKVSATTQDSDSKEKPSLDIDHSIDKKELKSRLRSSKKDKNVSQDDKPVQKAPRSNKGRAARRGVSPSDESKVSTKSNDQNMTEKEPLEFMSMEELINRIGDESRDAGEFPEQMLQNIATMIRADLNRDYEDRARLILDDYLRAMDEEKDAAVDIDLVLL